MKKTLVLAYSGGLDTSFCISYLTREKKFSVHAIHVDTGGFSRLEIEELENRAYSLGASHFKSIDVSDNYYKKCLKYLLFGNILRNDTYPLSVSSERIFQALAIVNYAQSVSADAIAHGSTAAGNDQIRFDLVFNSMAPEVKIITPIRDLKLTRKEEVDYLARNGFAWSAQKQTYSVNQGIWGTTIGGKETLSSRFALPEHAYLSKCHNTTESEIVLDFDRGEPIKLNDVNYSNPIDLIRTLNDLAANYAIGRDIHVGDTVIGIKGRVAFEAPAAMILIKAHQLLEKHTLSKWQAYWKKQLSDWYGMMIHEGQYLDPVMRNIEKYLEDTQKTVIGKVYLMLKPYHFDLIGIESDFDLMQAKFGVYGEMNHSWSGQDARGFTKILSIPHRIFHELQSKEAQV